jgi:hypothetical protein
MKDKNHKIIGKLTTKYIEENKLKTVITSIICNSSFLFNVTKTKR